MKRRTKPVVLFTFVLLFSFVIHLSGKDIYLLNGYDHTISNEMITVATYNIRYGNGQDGKFNFDRTMDTIRLLDADIISLQEVERFSFRSRFTDQVSRLARELQMNVVYYPSLSYPGIYYGNVILSKYPIKETVVLPFQNKLENRSALFAKVALNEKDMIYVANTHLGLNREERKQAIYEIYETLKLLEGPVIVKGDLNATPDKQEYEIWNTLLTKSNEGQEIHTFLNRDWQIDYIFYSSEFEPLSTVVFESDASDHFPVISKLSLSTLIKD